jgi:hypothetical protein
VGGVPPKRHSSTHEKYWCFWHQFETLVEDQQGMRKRTKKKASSKKGDGRKRSTR